MHGAHFSCGYATTQKPIATSSGESEFYGIFKARSRSIGHGLMASDLGAKKACEVHAEGTAGIGMSQRRGVGNVRHLHVQALWTQQAVADGRIKLFKVKGAENPANLPTKHVGSKELHQHLIDMGFEVRGGKSDIAIQMSRDAG